MAWDDGRQRRRGGYEAYAGSSMAPELIEAQGVAPLLKIPGQMVEHERMARGLALDEAKFREDKLQSDRESLEALRELGLFGAGGAAAGAPGVAEGGGRPAIVSPGQVSGLGQGIGMTRPEDLVVEQFAQDPATVAREMELQKSYADLYALEQGRLADVARLEGGGPWRTADTTQALIQQLGFSPERAARAAAQVSAGGETPALRAAKRRAKARGVEVGPTAYRRGLGAEAEKAAAQRGVVAEELRRLGVDIPEEDADAIAKQLERWGMLPESPYAALPEGGRPSTYAQALAVEQTRPMATLLEGGWMGKEAMERLQKMRAYEQTLRARGDEAAAREFEEVRRAATEMEAREYEIFRKGMYNTVKDSVGKRWGDEKINDFIATYWDNEDAAQAQHAKLAEIIKQRIAVSAHHRQITENQKNQRILADSRAKQHREIANRNFNERLDFASAGLTKQKEAYKAAEAAHFDRTDKKFRVDYTEAEKAEEDALFAHGEALDAAERAIDIYRAMAISPEGTITGPAELPPPEGGKGREGAQARKSLDKALQEVEIVFEGRTTSVLGMIRPDDWVGKIETSVPVAEGEAALRSLGGKIDPLAPTTSKVPAGGTARLGTRDIETVAGWAHQNGLFDTPEGAKDYIKRLSAEEQREFAGDQQKVLAARESRKDVKRTKPGAKDEGRSLPGAIPAEEETYRSKDDYTEAWEKEAVSNRWQRSSTRDFWQKFDSRGRAIQGAIGDDAAMMAAYPQ